MEGPSCCVRGGPFCVPEARAGMPVRGKALNASSGCFEVLWVP